MYGIPYKFKNSTDAPIGTRHVSSSVIFISFVFVTIGFSPDLLANFTTKCVTEPSASSRSCVPDTGIPIIVPICLSSPSCNSKFAYPINEVYVPALIANLVNTSDVRPSNIFSSSLFLLVPTPQLITSILSRSSAISANQRLVTFGSECLTPIFSCNI